MRVRDTLMAPQPPIKFDDDVVVVRDTWEDVLNKHTKVLLYKETHTDSFQQIVFPFCSYGGGVFFTDIGIYFNSPDMRNTVEVKIRNKSWSLKECGEILKFVISGVDKSGSAVYIDELLDAIKFGHDGYSTPTTIDVDYVRYQLVNIR